MDNSFLRFNAGSDPPPPIYYSSEITEASHSSGLASIRGKIMLNSGWTMWQWGRFFPSTSVSFANCQFINCSTFINHPLVSILKASLNRKFTKPETCDSVPYTCSRRTATLFVLTNIQYLSLATVGDAKSHPNNVFYFVHDYETTATFQRLN
jgi:hypothetical protein